MGTNGWIIVVGGLSEEQIKLTLYSNNKLFIWFHNSSVDVYDKNLKHKMKEIRIEIISSSCVTCVKKLLGVCEPMCYPKRYFKVSKYYVVVFLSENKVVLH